MGRAHPRTRSFSGASAVTISVLLSPESLSSTMSRGASEVLGRATCQQAIVLIQSQGSKKINPHKSIRQPLPRALSCEASQPVVTVDVVRSPDCDIRNRETICKQPNGYVLDPVSIILQSNGNFIAVDHCWSAILNPNFWNAKKRVDHPWRTRLARWSCLWR